MFLLVSVRHVGTHPDELQYGVSIQSSINLGKAFPRISRIRIIPSTQILARVFVYLPPFISQILDYICRLVLIFILTLKTSNTAFGFPVIQLCNGPFARNCHTWNKKTLLDGKRRRGAGKTEATSFKKLIPFLFKVPLTFLPSSKVGFVPVPVLCKGPNSFPRQYPLQMNYLCSSDTNLEHILAVLSSTNTAPEVESLGCFENLCQ